MNRKISKILLCEDNENLGVIVSEHLNAKGYKVDLFLDGDAGYEAFENNEYELCIIDLLLSKQDGLTLADKIRVKNSEMPIIFTAPKSVTAETIEKINKITDLYLLKPFTIQDLLRSIRSTKHYVSRVSVDNIFLGDIDDEYIIGAYTLDVKHRLLAFEGKSTRLTKKEAGLLTILAVNANVLLERNYIIDKIWNYDGAYYQKSRSMDVYICKLRKLLADDSNVILINFHSRGYKLVIPKK